MGGGATRVSIGTVITTRTPPPPPLFSGPNDIDSRAGGPCASTEIPLVGECVAWGKFPFLGIDSGGGATFPTHINGQHLTWWATGTF